MLDDIAPPPPQILRRECGAPGCRAWARSGGRHCKAHAAAAAQAWRRRNRTKIRAQRRQEAVNRTEEERAADAARAKLAVYVSRGKILRGICAQPGCYVDETTAYIPDPHKWKTPLWVCADHRVTIVEEQVGIVRRLQERDAYVDRRERALAFFEALPPQTQDGIRERAARGPMGLRLDPQSPLYAQRLVAETEDLMRTVRP